jgi:hypothetical protein
VTCLVPGRVGGPGRRPAEGRRGLEEGGRPSHRGQLVHIAPSLMMAAGETTRRWDHEARGGRPRSAPDGPRAGPESFVDLLRERMREAGAPAAFESL